MDQQQPKLRHKSFTYATRVSWIENRAGSLASDGKTAFRVASPPEFKGEVGVWTPEDLFVGAVEACTMTTFVAFSSRLKIPLISYESSAEGLLEFVDGGYAFTKVIVRPRIVVGSPEAAELARKAIEDAHRSCLISNSVRAVVEVEPMVDVSTEGSV